MKFPVGERVTLRMKPIPLVGWVIVGETEKSVLIRRRFESKHGPDYRGDCYYVAKKNIVRIERLSVRK